MFIMETDAQTIELHLTTNLERSAMQSFLYTLIKFTHLLFVISIGKRKHGPFVEDLLELVVQIAPHTLSRAIGIE